MIIPLSYIPYITSFLFVFAIVFGLLSQMNILGSKNVNAIIAIVFAVVSVAYAPFVTFLYSILPIAAVFLVIVFFFIFVKKLFSGGQQGSMIVPAVILAVSLVLLGVLWSDISKLVPVGIRPDDVLWAIGLFAIVMIFYLSTQQESTIPQQ
jgi:hypothetical protein